MVSQVGDELINHSQCFYLTLREDDPIPRKSRNNGYVKEYYKRNREQILERRAKKKREKLLIEVGEKTEPLKDNRKKSKVAKIIRCSGCGVLTDRACSRDRCRFEVPNDDL